MDQLIYAEAGGTKNWFTSDLHFDHEKLVELRGFKSKDEMNWDIVKSINEKVGFNDTLWLLGDISFAPREDTLAWLKKINARTINLVEGNHDNQLKHKIFDGFFSSVSPLVRKTFTLYKSVNGDEPRKVRRPVTLCHYPMYVWDRMHHGAYHLHGHSHGSCLYPSESRTLDVGWDVHRGPVSLSDIAVWMSSRPVQIRDQHQKAFDPFQEDLEPVTDTTGSSEDTATG